MADPDFLAVVQRLFDRNRRVLLIEALQRAAMRSHDRTGVRKRVQIAADGHARDVEAVRQLLDGRALFLVQQLQNASASFLDEQFHTLAVRHPHTLQRAHTETRGVAATS